MAHVPTDDLLNKLPKKTPIWAVGVTTVLVAVVTCLVTLYLITKDDFKQYLGWAESHHEQMDKIKFEESDNALTSILRVVEVNSQKLINLSSTLGNVQNQNIVLTERVSALERAVNELKGNLNGCEIRLKACYDSKK